MNDWDIYNENMKFYRNIMTDNFTDVEAEKNKLLQDELNLTEDIAKEEDRLEDAVAKLNAMIAEAKEIKANIERLTCEREQIHKTWIQKFSNPGKKSVLKEIFDKYFAGTMDEFYEFASVVDGNIDWGYFCNQTWDFRDIIARIAAIGAGNNVFDYLYARHDKPVSETGRF